MKKVEENNEELEKIAKEFKPVKDPNRFNGLLHFFIAIIIILIVIIFGSFYLVFMSGKYRVVYVDDIRESFYEDYYESEEDYEEYDDEEYDEEEYSNEEIGYYGEV